MRVTFEKGNLNFEIDFKILYDDRIGSRRKRLLLSYLLNFQFRSTIYKMIALNKIEIYWMN